MFIPTSINLPWKPEQVSIQGKNGYVINPEQVEYFKQLIKSLNLMYSEIANAINLEVSDTAYGVSWDEVKTIAPSKNAVYDKFNFLDLYSLAGVQNLKPVVNASVNKLDIFTKSGGAVPDASNIITVAIPDGNGFTLRNRASAVASGTGQIILADAANYWSKGSLDAEIKTAYLYAIWSTADGGIVFALNGYSGFTRCPASVTATDDDYMHLEASSSYTPVITDYCVAIAKIRYQYDTADAPDHTIQATVLDAPQVIWNPRSDYGYQKSLATRITSASDIADDTRISIIIKQSGKYFGIGKGTVYCSGGGLNSNMHLRMGSTTYASATEVGLAQIADAGAFWNTTSASAERYLNAGEAIHFGIGVNGTSGNRIIEGDDNQTAATTLYFKRSD